MPLPGGSSSPRAPRPLTPTSLISRAPLLLCRKAEEMQRHEYVDKECTLGGFIHPRVRVKVFYFVTRWSSCSQQCFVCPECLSNFLLNYRRMNIFQFLWVSEIPHMYLLKEKKCWLFLFKLIIFLFFASFLWFFFVKYCVQVNYLSCNFFVKRLTIKVCIFIHALY